jgi:hypothetical protein
MPATSRRVIIDAESSTAPVADRFRFRTPAVTIERRQWAVATAGSRCFPEHENDSPGRCYSRKLTSVNSVHTHTSRRARTPLRLSEAKRLMLAGEPPAMAAAGFADQSHLIRKFKEAYGVTPGQYLAQCNNVQSTANAGVY